MLCVSIFPLICYNYIVAEQTLVPGNIYTIPFSQLPNNFQELSLCPELNNIRLPSGNAHGPHLGFHVQQIGRDSLEYSISFTTNT